MSRPAGEDASAARKIGYAERAAYYEIEDDDVSDHPLISWLLTPAVASVLEVPCGVGRNTRLLLTGRPRGPRGARGPRELREPRRVLAIDREPAMIERLRQRLSSLPGAERLSTRTGDMRDLELGAERFDLVVVQREAFQFLLTRDEALAALTGFARHLAPRGTLMLDLASFSSCAPEDGDAQVYYFDPGRPDGLEVPDWTRPLPDGGSMTRSRVQSHHPGGLVGLEFRYDVCDPLGRHQRWSAEIRFAVYTREEIGELARDAGLAVRAVYRDYRRRPYRAGAPRMVFLLGRAPRRGRAAAVPGAAAAARPAARPAPVAAGEPVVGWIKGLDQGFDNERDFRSLTGFDGMALDPDRQAYFRRYFATWYYDRFIAGQGTERILDDLSRFGVPGRWLDLGAGTTTLFWSIPLAGITAISCCDVAVEALAVLAEVARAGQVPPCYREVLASLGKPVEHVYEMARRIDRYLVFDTLRPWPGRLAGESFELITAFGNFGIASDAAQYEGCFREVARHLAAGGRAIGADWLRRPELIAADGHDNSYLEPARVGAAAAGAGLRLLDCEAVPVAGDEQYRGLICWAMENPGGERVRLR